jgi:hypothetical protein
MLNTEDWVCHFNSPQPPKNLGMEWLPMNSNSSFKKTEMKFHHIKSVPNLFMPFSMNMDKQKYQLEKFAITNFWLKNC